MNSFLESNAVWVLGGARLMGEGAFVLDCEGHSTLIVTPAWDVERAGHQARHLDRRAPSRSGPANSAAQHTRVRACGGTLLLDESLGAEDNFVLMSASQHNLAVRAAGERVLDVGDILLSEITPCCRGQFAQISRTAVIGDPQPLLSEKYAVLQDAMEHGLAAGRSGASVTRVINNVFKSAWSSAPVLIVILGDGRRQWGTVQGALTFGRHQSHLTDALANAATLMHLAARRDIPNNANELS